MTQLRGAFTGVLLAFVLWGTQSVVYGAQTETTAMCTVAAGTLGGVLTANVVEGTQAWWSQGRQIPLGWSANGETLYTLEFGVVDLPLFALSGETSSEIAIIPSLNTALSPDGMHVASLRAGSENDTAIQLEIINIETGEVSLTVPVPQPPSALFWSPDSSHIGTVLQGEEGNTLISIDVDSGEITEIAALDSALYDGLPNEAPQWSPDGRWIALTVAQEDAPALALVDVEQGTVEVVANDALYPRWSPDGTSLLYAHEGLQRLSLETGETETLDSHSPAVVPAWSPDGEWIAYLSVQLPPTGLYPNALRLLSLTSGESSAIELEADVEFHPVSPVWSPVCNDD